MYGPRVLPTDPAALREHSAWMKKAFAVMDADVARQAREMGLAVEEWVEVMKKRFPVEIDPHADPADYGI